MSKNSLIIICCILFVVIAVLVHMLKEFKWYQKSYYELANKIAKDRRDRKMLVRADREMIKSEIDKKFLKEKIIQGIVLNWVMNQEDLK